MPVIVLGLEGWRYQGIHGHSETLGDRIFAGNCPMGRVYFITLCTPDCLGITVCSTEAAAELSKVLPIVARWRGRWKAKGMI